MQYTDDPTDNREARACREAIAAYRTLFDSVPLIRQKIPASLIRAICDYGGLEEPEDQEPAGINRKILEIDYQDDLSKAIVQIIFFYAGFYKPKTLTEIRRLTKRNEREILRMILLRKQEIETQETGG